MKKNKKEDLNQEIDPYKVDKLSKVPSWIIIFFIKFWAAAAAVFFIVNGGTDLGFDFSSGNMSNYAEVLGKSFVIIILIALFLALFQTYIVRPIVRLMYNRRNNTFKYNLINVKGFKSFLFSFLYMLFVSFVLYFVTLILGKYGLILDPFGTTGGVGIEPFTYGLCFLVLDSICLGVKNLIINLKARIVYKKQILTD